MKKFIQYIFVSVFISALLGACSPSEDNVDDKKKYISKITVKYLNDIYVTDVFNFIYDKNEVVKIESNEGFCDFFNYEGSKIISSSGCENDHIRLFSYIENKLNKISSDEVINEFFYDSDKLKEIKSSNIADNFTQKYGSKYYFLGNNVASTSNVSFWRSEPRITEYKYDTKNNPFKNHNLYLKLVWGPAFLGDNNAIEEIFGDLVIKYTIIYDSDDFPIKVTGINQKTGKLRTEFTYEYIKL